METYDSIHTKDPVKWETSLSNNIGRLAQGVGTFMENVNINIFLIPKYQVTTGQNTTYVNPV